MNEPLPPLEHRIAVDDGVRLLVVEHKADSPCLRFPVVFVPGWVSHRSVWNELIGSLAGAARILHVEGRDKESADLSAARAADMSVARQARDLAAVVAALGLEAGRFHLVGSSTGSNVILDYLLSAPGAGAPPAAAAAVLMIPVHHFPIPLWARPLLWLPHHVITALKPAIKHYIRLALVDRSGRRTMLGYNFASIDRLEPRRTRLTARALLGYTLPRDLSRIRVPTLVAAARADPMHRGEVADAIAASVPSCELLDVGESGRVHSSWMAGRLLDFLGRAERAPGV